MRGRIPLLILVGVLTLSTGCEGPLSGRGTPIPENSQLPALPTVESYFQAWGEEQYEEMYGLLTSSAQQEISEEAVSYTHLTLPTILLV